MKAGGGYTKKIASADILSQKGKKDIAFSNIKKELLLNKHIAEFLFLTFTIHSLPNIFSASKGNIKYISIIEKLRLWEYFSEEKKAELLKKGVLVNCKNLIDKLNALKSGDQNIKLLVTDFFSSMKIINNFSSESSLSTDTNTLTDELKNLLKNNLQELKSLEKKIPKGLFQDTIKPLLSKEPVSSTSNLEVGQKDILLLNLLHSKELAEIMYDFFENKQLSKNKLSIVFAQTYPLFLVLDFYRTLANAEQYKEFAEYALEICKQNLLKASAEFSNDDKISCYKNIILITDKLCFHQLNVGELSDYKSSITTINTALDELLTMLESQLTPDYQDYAIHRAYFRLSELNVEKRNIPKALEYSLNALQYHKDESVLYVQLFSNFHLIKLEGKAIDKESYIDEFLEYIPEEEIKSDIKNIFLQGLDNAMYLGDENSNVLFQNYQEFNISLIEKYHTNHHLVTLIKKNFYHDQIWLNCLTNQAQELKNLLENPVFKLEDLEILHILSLANDMDVKLLIDGIDFIPNRLEAQYSASKIWLDLFKDTQNPEYLIKAKEHLTKANVRFKASYLQVNSDVEESLYTMNLNLLFISLTTERSCDEYLELLNWLRIKKITAIDIARKFEKDSSVYEEFLSKSKIIDFINIAEEHLSNTAEIEKANQAELIFKKARQEEKIALQKKATVEEFAIGERVSLDEDVSISQVLEEKTFNTKATSELQSSLTTSCNIQEMSPLDRLMKLQNYAYKQLKICTARTIKKLYGLPFQDSKSDITSWSYEGKIYSSEDPSVIELKNDLYGVVDYENSRYNQQIEGCKTTLSKGFASSYLKVDGVKWLKNTHYEIKTFSNGDFRLVAKLLLQNDSNKRLLVFNEGMTHKQVAKWLNESVTVITVQSALDSSMLVKPSHSIEDAKHAIQENFLANLALLQVDDTSVATDETDLTG
jgi:hypothetical protein